MQSHQHNLKRRRGPGVSLAGTFLFLILLVANAPVALARRTSTTTQGDKRSVRGRLQQQQELNIRQRRRRQRRRDLGVGDGIGDENLYPENWLGFGKSKGSKKDGAFFSGSATSGSNDKESPDAASSDSGISPGQTEVEVEVSAPTPAPAQPPFIAGLINSNNNSGNNDDNDTSDNDGETESEITEESDETGDSMSESIDGDSESTDGKGGSSENDNSSGGETTTSDNQGTGSSTESTNGQVSSPTSSNDNGSSTETTNGSVEGGSDNDPANGGNDDDVDVCGAISSQQPIEGLADASTDFSVSVAVVYETEVTSSADILSHLDTRNVPFALEIAGCSTPDATTGKRRRNLQESDSSAPWTITYSKVDPWASTGTCDEESNSENKDPFIDGLLDSSASMCQQEFTSNVQVQTKGDVSSEDLESRIAQAFDTAVKFSLESQPGVVAVTIPKTNKEGEEQLVTENQGGSDELQIDEFQSMTPTDNENSRTIIIACSIVAACVFVCIVCLVLIGLYERRRNKLNSAYKKYGYKGKTRVAHVPLVDEVGTFDEDEEYAGHDLILVSSNKVGGVPFDESETDDDDLDDQSEDLPPPPPELEVSPCHRKHGSGPFDERPPDGKCCSAATCRVCESERQMGTPQRSRSSQIRAIDSSAPATAPMNITPNTMTTPRIERRPLSVNPDTSRRHYILEDLVEL